MPALNVINFLPAFLTKPPVDTYYRTAVRARPSHCFKFQKLFHSKVLYHFKVFEHTHIIPVSVPFIELLKPGARDFFTVVAVS
jgi:hypothetical protein